MFTKQVAISFWLITLLVVIFVAIDQVGNPFLYLFKPAPLGQALYLNAKLFGICGIVLLWWQTNLGIIKSLQPSSNIAWITTKIHKRHGQVTFMFVILHASLFIFGASIRSGHPALHWLIPNFENYYTSRVSFGAISIFALTIAVSLPIYRAIKKSTGKIYKKIHLLGFITLPLAIFHAASIGSETRSTAIIFVFATLAAFTLLLLFQLLLQVSTKKHLVD
jgi:uncharacterized membrane protein